MVVYTLNSELLPERTSVAGSVSDSLSRSEHGGRLVRRGKRFGRILKLRFSLWVFLVAALTLSYLAVFGLKMFFHGNMDSIVSSSSEVQQQFAGSDFVEPRRSTHLNAGNLENIVSSSQEVKAELSGYTVVEPQRSKRRTQHFPCKIGLLESIDDLVEAKDFMNFTRFPLKYIDKEDKQSRVQSFEPRFGGHQSLEEREKSFNATTQIIHCGFVKGPRGFSSTGFDLDEKDRKYMSTCEIAVSSCIFGNSDFLRRPKSRMISEFSKKNVCFVMFVDEQTLSKLSSEGNIPDDGYIGLWRIVIVRNLPYKDMRKSGKVPKFLSHRLFPSSRYSLWLDSKLRLVTDPMLIIEYFLWRSRSEYAISNHYDRHCVWEEVLQNKRLNKYNHTAIDEQFMFYQSDGLTKFDPSDPNTPLPSYVPEGSFIVRAHTPMSNLFSCLWFNEVDQFTSRDQLSFAYTYLKLRRTNPDRPFHLNMFKDCERRALTKLYQHRNVLLRPPPS